MRKFTKFATTGLLLLSLVVALLSFPVEVQALSYSTSSNSGTRDQVCTSLEGTSAASYYTGSYTYDILSNQDQNTLLQSLRTLMRSTHTYLSSYNDCHYKADKTDCENGNGKVTLIYTSYSAGMDEWNGWNREHVWPKSLGGKTDSNGTGGADMHHIRPSDATVNSTRGNKKYGYANGGKAAYGSNPASGCLGGYYSSTYYEPLDNVKGDVARICLYVYVRWGSDWGANSITQVFQSVDVLLEWMAIDPVDTWEMGRNEVVAAYQGNRNVFIDYPELAWTLFGRQAPKNMSTPSGNAASGNTGSGNTGNSGNSGNSGNTGSSGTTKPTACTHATTELRNVKQATCQEEGYTGDTHCTKCGKKLSDGKVTEKTGHTETLANQKDATCAEVGYTGDTVCSVCNVTLETGKEIPKSHSHTFGDWATTKQPTDTEVGEKARTCQVCGFRHAETLYPTGISKPETETPSIWIWVGVGAAGCAIVIAVTVILLKRKKNTPKA